MASSFGQGANDNPGDYTGFFEIFDENWKIAEVVPPLQGPIQIVKEYLPGFSLSGGNEDGHIFCSDIVANWTCFKAPDFYMGANGNWYGRILRYDMKASVGVTGAHTDVILEGSGITLFHDGTAPTSAWSTRTVPLIEGEWRKGKPDGPYATESEVRQALGGMTKLLLGADWSSANETTYLDNFSIWRGPTIKGSVIFEDLADPWRTPTGFTVRFVRTGTNTPIDSAVATVMPDGTFEVVSPAAFGEFDAIVKYSHWLQDRVHVVVQNTIAYGMDLVLKNGDADGNNEINLLDYDVFCKSYGFTVGQAGYNPMADFDQDGTVTLSDYAIFSKNFDTLGDK